MSNSSDKVERGTRCKRALTWEVKKDILMFYDRKYKIEKITADSLILSEFDRNEIEYVDPNPNTPFSQRIYFKRTKQ